MKTGLFFPIMKSNCINGSVVTGFDLLMMLRSLLLLTFSVSRVLVHSLAPLAPLPPRFVSILSPLWRRRSETLGKSKEPNRRVFLRPRERRPLRLCLECSVLLSRFLASPSFLLPRSLISKSARSSPLPTEGAGARSWPTNVPVQEGSRASRA